MKCRECGRTMLLDCVDVISKDNYWVCEHCMISCLEQIRYGQTWSELLPSENESVVDYTIKHEIRFR